MNVIKDGNGFVLMTGGEFGGDGRVSVIVFEFSHGKICSVTETKWWIISWVTGDFKKICIASESDMMIMVYVFSKKGGNLLLLKNGEYRAQDMGVLMGECIDC